MIDQLQHEVTDLQLALDISYKSPDDQFRTDCVEYIQQAATKIEKLSKDLDVSPSQSELTSS